MLLPAAMSCDIQSYSIWLATVLPQAPCGIAMVPGSSYEFAIADGNCVHTRVYSMHCVIVVNPNAAYAKRVPRSHFFGTSFKQNLFMIPRSYIV